MTSLPEQFSAARQTQLDNGFNLMRSLGEQALDRTSRVFALQLDASRAAVEQSSNALRQLLAARDPRDLLALGSQSQQQLRSLFDYSREMFSIAAGVVTLPALRTYSVDSPSLSTPSVAAPAEPQPAPRADAAQVAAEAFERIGADTASSLASATASATASGTAPGTAPATASSIILPTDADFALPTEASEAASATGIEVVTSDIVPQAAPTILAKATGEALDLPVAPPHPLAASVPVEVAVEIELPKVEPVDATPPPPAATVAPVDTRGTKGRKKQN